MMVVEALMHYGTKLGHFETLKIHFPTSEAVSEMSERANGRASGPVLTSRFLFVPDHSAAAAAAAQMGGDMGAMNNMNSAAMPQTFQPGYPFLPYYDQNGFMAGAAMNAAQQRAAAAQLGNPGAAAAMRLIPPAVLMNPAAG